ncbi:MAG TPA: amidohydrolase family protein, partial [Thermaerobacter sp.]
AWHERINPLSLFPVARDFPEIPFIIPHFGCGYPRELLHLMWSCPNVYVDTSGSNQWMRWHDSELTLEYLFKKFYETVGPERIIFGSDSSWFPRGFAVRYLQDQLRACYYLGMKDEDIDRIFYRNAAELFGLEPRQQPAGGDSPQR